MIRRGQYNECKGNNEEPEDTGADAVYPEPIQLRVFVPISPRKLIISTSVKENLNN